MTPEAIKKEIIHFQNNNRALAFFPSAKNRAEDLVASFDLPAYQALILILGGGERLDERLVPQLTQLFGRGIARAAREVKAVILDNGTKAGVLSLLGEGVASYGPSWGLIGVAPKSKISYSDHPADPAATGLPLEPNHSHFVLTEGAGWGSEAPMLFNLVRALTHRLPAAAGKDGKADRSAAGTTARPLPALAILAGGGPASRAEVLRTIRLNLPLIVIEGSGGLADEIAAARHRQDQMAGDPEMAEILAEGEIHLYPLHLPVKGIERLIARELGVDKVLRQAWETFADYDLNARHQQKRFDQLQLAILLVSVAGTALALFQQANAPWVAETGRLQPLAWGLAQAQGRWVYTPPSPWWILHHLLILIPILLLVLVTAANRFRQGTKWLVLRAGADAIRREIYLYRTRVRHYREKAEQSLSQRLADITRKTMQTEVNTSSLQPYSKDRGFPPYRFAHPDRDDGFSFLTPDRYVEWRLDDQIGFFKKGALRLEKQTKWFYWLTYIIGGIGAYLAAVNQQVWIALTTSLVAAIGAFLAYRQTENTLLRYNQVVTDLANIKVWWYALSAEEQACQPYIDLLIGHTERVLQSAQPGGAPQLQDALADLALPPAAAAQKDPLQALGFSGAALVPGPAGPGKKLPAEALASASPPAVPGAGRPIAAGSPVAADTAADPGGNGEYPPFHPEAAGIRTETGTWPSVQGRENGSA